MTQLQKAKRIRALLVQYDYKNCSKWIFDKLTNKIHELMDEENQRKKNRTRRIREKLFAQMAYGF